MSEQEQGRGPRNIEAERAVLGATMCDVRCFGAVADFLRPAHFADGVHRRIFEAAARLVGQGEKVDAVTMRDRVADDRRFESIGGVDRYLEMLCESAATLSTVRSYARSVHDRWLRREMLALRDELGEAAADNETTAEEIVGQLAKRAELLIGSGAGASLTRVAVLERLAEDLGRDLPCDRTGIPALDTVMGGGLFASRLYGIAGRKKAGKSLLLGTISHNLNMAGVPHLMVCAEMYPSEVEERNVGRALGFNARRFLEPRYRSDPKFRQAVADYARDCPSHVRYEKAPGLTFEDLRRVVIREVVQGRVRGVIVDYLQLVGGRPRNVTFSEHLDRVSQWIADTCRRYEVWGLMAAQLNQDSDNTNVRHGEGLRLAADQMYALLECKGIDRGRWLACWDSRYTPKRDVGAADSPGLWLKVETGPYFAEADPEMFGKTGWAA